MVARAVPIPDYPKQADLVADLAAAQDDERQGRAQIRAAIRRQAELLRQLQAAGLPVTWVVHRLGAARGEALSPRDRQRIACRLRKRAERETQRRVDLSGSYGLQSVATPSSDRVLPPTDEESIMPKLVKRTVVTETEEFEAEEEEQDEVESEDEVAEEEDAETEVAPAPRRRHK